MRVYELWLTSKESRHPFAALVEDGDQCAWTIATDTDGPPAPDWGDSIVGGWDRNAKDAWVLDAWRDFLEEISSATPEERQRQLKKLDHATAGIEVRRPRNVSSPLPPRALAYRWRRNRLGNPHDVVAAAIAARLGQGGKIHWRANIEVRERGNLQGEWIIETHVQRGPMLPHNEVATPDDAGQVPFPASQVPGATGLAVISIIDAQEIASIKARWSATKTRLANEYPFGIAVVRDSREAEVQEQGCIIGARFAAPVSLAEAATRYQWGRAKWPRDYSTSSSGSSDPDQM